VVTQAVQRVFTVLIPVADPRSGVPLLRMADMLCGAKDEKRRLLALHLRRAVEHEAYLAGIDATSVERDDTLAPILLDAERADLVVEPISFVGRDIADDITEVATARQADLVLMGFHKPVIGKAVLGGTVHRVLTGSPSDVAVFVNRGLDEKPKRVLVPYLGSSHDRLALDLAARIARNTGAETVVLHIVPPKRSSEGAALGARQEMERA
jgi:nucleotide-binding universal stress UspA family protein